MVRLVRKLRLSHRLPPSKLLVTLSRRHTATIADGGAGIAIHVGADVVAAGAAVVVIIGVTGAAVGTPTATAIGAATGAASATGIAIAEDTIK